MEPASSKIEASTLEKGPERSDSSSSISSQNLDHAHSETASDIDWLYLTFETDLPPTTASSSSRGNRNPGSASAVPCPNLDKYVSPFEWSQWRKTYVTWVACLSTVCAAYSAGAYSSGEEQMAREWHVSGVATEVGITTFTCGFAAFPMFLAPFSEINGRRPVFIASGAAFLLFQMACALVPSYGGMLVCRFIAGCACSTFSTISGGVVSDLYHAKDRNAAMTLFSAASLFGTGLGPMISGFIAQHTTWRWIFYAQLILDGVLLAIIVIFFKETRGSVLLSRKAKALNKWYEQLEQQGFYGVEMPSPTTPQKTFRQRIRWKVRSDEERASLFKMITISLYRPFRMLVTEPVVFFFSLWAAFSWAVLYMTFSAIPLVFTTTYGFNLEESGGVFAAISIASILFLIIAINQDKLARRYLSQRRGLFDAPEGRLFFACVESALLPIGCIWFGVTGAYPDIPWIVPALGLGCVTMGIFSIYLAVFNYLADTYHRYASSALAAQSFCRNMLGGVFPLFTAQMFRKLTFQGAGGLLGGIGFLLTLVPWVLIFFGPRIRARSKLASEIMPGS